MAGWDVGFDRRQWTTDRAWRRNGESMDSGRDGTGEGNGRQASLSVATVQDGEGCRQAPEMGALLRPLGNLVYFLSPLPHILNHPHRSARYRLAGDPKADLKRVTFTNWPLWTPRGDALHFR